MPRVTSKSCSVLSFSGMKTPALLIRQCSGRSRFLKASAKSRMELQASRKDGLVRNGGCFRRRAMGHAILLDPGKREERSPEGSQVDLHAVYFGLGRGLLF